MDSDLILLGHGSGGRLSHQLIEGLIVPLLSGAPAVDRNDAAITEIFGRRIAFTTDSYVVDPIFFPGGDIGSLSVNGTVNDLAMMGARPVVLSTSFIIEEGFSREALSRIAASMRQAADTAMVSIITGDTKVVPRGKGDKIFINTTGLGVFDHPFKISGSGARPGDKVILSGTMGDHGTAILASRENLELETSLISDCASLLPLVDDLLHEGNALHALRDPTRGGVGTTLKEIALQSQISIRLREDAIPVKKEVKGVCEILGLDPLYIANEGKLLAFVAAEAADTILERMRRHPLGRDAAIIGEVTEGSGKVVMETAIGGLRTIEMLAGEQFPRIC